MYLYSCAEATPSGRIDLFGQPSLANLSLELGRFHNKVRLISLYLLTNGKSEVYGLQTKTKVDSEANTVKMHSLRAWHRNDNNEARLVSQVMK